MGSIYGWLSKHLHPPFAGAVADQRVASPQGGFQHVSVEHRRNNAEIGGHALNQAPHFFQSGPVTAVLTGNPVWNDSVLARWSKEHNPAYALLEGYQREGRAILAKLGGEFACCLMEPERRYALLAIDRVGIGALAFSVQGDTLVFGSQLDQIIAHPAIHPAISPQGIFNYLYFHVIPSPESIYQGVYKLQPAEFVEFGEGHLKRGFYWQPHYSDSRLPKKALLKQLHEQLQQAAEHCPHGPDIGAFLSGGLDSSTVVGLYGKIARRPVDAFTIGFSANGYDEMDYARLTARHFQAKLHEYYVTPKDVLDALPLIASSYDEPFGNASAIPAYYCAKLAREQGMKGLLAGDGGDEIFVGNARYAKQKLFDYYRHLPGLAKRVLEVIAVDLPLLRKLKSYVQQAAVPMPQRLETYNYLHRTPLSEIFSGDFLAQINPELPIQNLQQTYQRGPTDDLVKNMLFLDHKFTLADNDLRKVNRTCELAGIEVFYPMLQENLLDFAASIPSGWLMKGFELRSFYKDGMRGFLPNETLAKSKMGFGLPFGVWMRTDKDLQEFSLAKLEAFSRRGLLNPDWCSQLIAQHQKGHAAYYGVMIWILVLLEQWLSTHS